MVADRNAYKREVYTYKYRNDPDFREAERKRQREAGKRMREAREGNPEVHAAHKAQWKASREARKLRMENDAMYRRHVLERNRADKARGRARKRALKEASDGQP